MGETCAPTFVGGFCLFGAAQGYARSQTTLRIPRSSAGLARGGLRRPWSSCIGSGVWQSGGPHELGRDLCWVDKSVRNGCSKVAVWRPTRPHQVRRPGNLCLAALQGSSHLVRRLVLERLMEPMARISTGSEAGLQSRDSRI
jgi:hypothetical protein